MNFGGAVRINRCGLVFLIGLVLLIILYSTFRRGPDPVIVVIDADEDSLLSSSFMRSKGFSTSGKVSLKGLLSAAIDAAKLGGAEVVAVRNSGDKDLKETIKGKTKEGVKDSATEGDYRSHKVMFYGLRKAFPQVKVISEEHTETPADLAEVVPASALPTQEVLEHMQGDDTLDAEDIAIWIDPLDATKEYTERLVEFVTTMVGISLRGKPVLGVIHRPFTGETYWGVVGHGFSPNLVNKEEASSQNQLNSILRIIVSKSHAGNVANLSRNVLPKGQEVQILSAAGAGYKVLEVIQGRAEAYVHTTFIKKWDVCAGQAIISALNGFMTTLNGETIDFSGHSDPLNTKGIIAYMKDTPTIQKLKTIQVKE